MKYPVVETFQSIQGEGCFMGCPANFIRLAGCPNLCKFCDTDLQAKEHLTETELAQRISCKVPLTVITGGEPCIHDLSPLIKTIRLFNPEQFIAVETSGVRRVPNSVDWITLSPKNGKCRRSVFEKANEIKWLYPLFSIEQIWNFVRVWPHRPNCKHFLQPINYKKRLNPINVKNAIDALLNNTTPLKIRLGIQLHKILNVR